MFEQLLGSSGPYDEIAKTFMKYKLMSDVGDKAFSYLTPKSEDEELNTRLKKLQVYQLEKGFGLPDSQKFESAINNEQWDTAKFLGSRIGFKHINEMSDWRPKMPSGKMQFDVDQGMVQHLLKSFSPEGASHGLSDSQWLKPVVRTAESAEPSFAAAIRRIITKR